MKAANWTGEKEPIITAPPASRILVEAGPGTGKTFTLIERLKYLVSHYNLAPASEILVLSFSVSAVTEIRKRLAQAVSGGHYPDSLDFLQIRTFDSWASRLLIDAGLGSDLQGRNYDDRIQMAVNLLRNGKNIERFFSNLKHVFIDELQDLVCIRADLAFEVLAAAKCGFTLLGDSAQAIYDFSINPALSTTTSAELLDKICRAFPDLDRTHYLTKNVRVDGNEYLERLAIHGREMILEESDMVITNSTG